MEIMVTHLIHNLESVKQNSSKEQNTYTIGASEDTSFYTVMLDWDSKKVNISTSKGYEIESSSLSNCDNDSIVDPITCTTGVCDFYDHNANSLLQCDKKTTYSCYGFDETSVGETSDFEIKGEFVPSLNYSTVSFKYTLEPYQNIYYREYEDSDDKKKSV